MVSHRRSWNILTAVLQRERPLIVVSAPRGGGTAAPSRRQDKKKGRVDHPEHVQRPINRVVNMGTASQVSDLCAVPPS